VVARLRDEFVAGRLSHETFLHRVHVVLESRRQADLPPVLADLPAPPAPAGLPAPAGRPDPAAPAAPAGLPASRSLGHWLRATWSRVTGPAAAPPPAGRQAGRGTVSRARGAARALTTSMVAAAGHGQPLALQFPRGDGRQFSIGRDASCDLAIADMTVSRRHAQLERTAQGWLLTDLESTNGTRVNGWRVRGQVPVRSGDLVSFGSLETVLY
jgi:hypothetical protein